MKINIDNKPYATDLWFSGEITVDVGDEQEYREKSYEFTLFDGENENISGNLFITWISETPNNNEEIEQQIIKQYQER